MWTYTTYVYGIYTCMSHICVIYDCCVWAGNLGPPLLPNKQSIHKTKLVVRPIHHHRQHNAQLTGVWAVIRDAEAAGEAEAVFSYIPTSVYQSLVIPLVLSRLDYGNATLAGLPTSLLNRLQSVINLAAWSIAGLRHSEHITDALASFHWLQVPECTGGHCVPSSSRHCTLIPIGPASVCRWFAVEMSRPAALVDLQYPWHPSVSTCYCRQSLVCNPWGIFFWFLQN